MYKQYPVIAICGPQEARQEYLATEHSLSCHGNIVISTAFFGQIDAELSDIDRKNLDITRRKKIDMADELFVVNVDGLLDDDTRRCIEYAKSLHIIVRYLCAWDQQLLVPKKHGETEAPNIEIAETAIRMQELVSRDGINKVRMARRAARRTE